ncbi:MAG: GNAT family N-acetyltransferase [Burkholderiaceae bacterium]|nr:GNAT family N-acetyltransferase [Burkholderiaceae bacterium]
MLLNTNLSLRPATQADWPAIEALLLANKLPLDGAQAHLDTYLLAVSNGEVVGCAGAEIYGRVALMRSVAVAPGLHRQGIGKLLLDRLIHDAQRRDTVRLYLLTVTAPEYFAQYGFKRGKIEDAPQALRASAEFQGACPAWAAFMSRALHVTPRRSEALPVAILGAGPVGLAAAARLLERHIPFVILEAGKQVGANLLDYGHVRLFSPWQYNVDPAMAKHLAANGWQAPPAADLPLAREVVERVLLPFAALPEVAPALKLNTRVIAVSRECFDKVKSAGRSESPFIIRAVQGGEPIELRASAVIDATGTWGTPNPVGANGLQALGEAEAQAQISYGIPDILGSARARFEGRRTLVVGAGHSAANALLALAELARQSPGTTLTWSVRSLSLTRVFGGGSADALPARGQLGASLRALRDSGALAYISGLRITAIKLDAGQLTVTGLNAQGEPVTVPSIDQIICATGQRPDLALTSELRVKLDPWLESTEALGPLIDPNVHSCGTVRPHGHRELAHPESGLYTVGVKSYGRAPTFLMATGFEQVRSVVAAIAGDLEAADRVELDLPETGVCGIGTADSSDTENSCCGDAPVVATAAVASPKSRCCG